MSASRVASSSSGLTFACVRESGIVVPSGSCPLRWPGSTSTTMSLRLVFGRSSSRASGWISGAYLGSMSMPTTACPSSTRTESIFPIWIPATTTAWPCPGVTACAELNSASRWKNSCPKNGTQLGRAAFCWERIPRATARPAITSRQTARKSPVRPRSWRRRTARQCDPLLGCAGAHGEVPVGAGLGGPTPPSPALRSGASLVWHLTSGR